MSIWNRTGYAPRNESGQILASMDADDAEPMDEAAEIGEVLFPIVRAFFSVAAVAVAAAGVLTFWSPMT